MLYEESRFGGTLRAGWKLLRLAVQSALKDVTVHGADDLATLNRLLGEGVDLLLVNRVLDYGFDSETGAELIADLPVANPIFAHYVVSNYPEAAGRSGRRRGAARDSASGRSAHRASNRSFAKRLGDR